MSDFTFEHESNENGESSLPNEKTHNSEENQVESYIQNLLEYCIERVGSHKHHEINYGNAEDVLDFSDMFKVKAPTVTKKKKKKAKAKKCKIKAENAEGELEDVSSFQKPIEEEEEKFESKHPFEENVEEEPEADPLEQVDNEDLENLQPRSVEIVYEIPRNLTITQEQMSFRKHLDLRRWYCMSRPQYAKSCGMSSMISCWNFLYSTLGAGTLPPLSQEEALTLLGFEPPFGEIRFGPVTGNGTLMRWFGLLNKHFNLKGKAYTFWKLHGHSRTLGVEPEECLERLEESLRGDNMAFVYHCYNHYFCPIGYEITPTKPADAYKSIEAITSNEVEHWIIIGEPSKCYPCFHVKKWKEIVKDIDCQNPDFYNLRKPELGVQQRKGKTFTEGKKFGGNIHCIIAFERFDK